MKTENAILRLAKIAPVRQHNRKFLCTIPGTGHTVEFLDCGGEIDCIRTRRNEERDELESDYFAGCWFDNLKQAVAAAYRWAPLKEEA